LTATLPIDRPQSAASPRPPALPHRHRRAWTWAALCTLPWLAVAGSARADEGMWMPQQVPELAAELRARGLALDPAQMADLVGFPMGAIVSLGGCTATFVSPQGLIVTNHHCVYSSLQYNASAERDLVTNGFLAKTLADELPTAPGSYVYVTSAIRDVTTEVLAGLDRPELAAEERLRTVRKRQNELTDACERPGGVRCRVAMFFEGSLFLEITQLEIRDVRLVYAPAEGIGNYGGEIDNWMWPRHTGDFAYLRAYVGTDGRPADPSPANLPYRPAHFLKFSTAGIDEGDFVWIAGYPGRTFRYATAEETREAETFTLPTAIRWARELNAILEREGERGRDVALANYARIRRNANAMKKFEGVLSGMQGDVALRPRLAREAALRARLGSDPVLAARLGDPLSEMSRLNAERSRLREQDAVLVWLERGSVLVGQALELYRLASERPKPDVERAEGFRERDLARFDQAVVRAQRSIELQSDRAGFRYVLAEAAKLPADQRLAPLDRALAATGQPTAEAQIEALLDRLYADTQLGDLPARQAMARESLAQLDAREDSLLAFVRELWPLYQAQEQREDAFDGAMLAVRPRYLAGLREVAGGRLYPDANSTLRLTFGNVTGYRPRDGVVYAPQTSLPGVVAKATGKEPFAAPTALLAAAQRPLPPAYVDPELGTVPVGFLATCDITGGNSGSAVLNGRGEIVGLAFDGNLEGVLSDYTLVPELVRTISVDAVYMRWVMDAVDGAHHLLEEMGLPVYYR
jgi:hypothetical protein